MHGNTRVDPYPDRMPDELSRVEVELSGTVRDYWRARLRQHTADVYAGLALSKFPEDLRVYEHLLWASSPSTVVEIGTHEGGSALWFRDRLETLVRYGRIASCQVISIDLDVSAARDAIGRIDPGFEQTIILLEGDVLDPALPARVAELIGQGDRCLVVDDSAHTYETTIAALRGFSRFVPVEGFFVVEDGAVDFPTLRLDSTWPRGVIPAVAEWLSSDDGAGFEVRRELELYGISCHPWGFLQRVA